MVMVLSRPARIAACLAGLVLAAGLAGCGGDDGEAAAPTAGPQDAAAPTVPTTPDQPAGTATVTTPAPAPTPEPEPTALPGLPAYTAGFEAWPRLNDAPIPPNSADSGRVGFDAHLSTKNVHVRRPAAAGGYRDGAIVVKAGRTGGAITLVAVMRKVAGVDPEHGDWEFVEWKRGSASERFATDASLTGATCWSCHVTARETDWVFTQPG